MILSFIVVSSSLKPSTPYIISCKLKNRPWYFCYTEKTSLLFDGVAGFSLECVVEISLDKSKPPLSHHRQGGFVLARKTK